MVGTSLFALIDDIATIHPSSHILGVHLTGPKVLQHANSNNPEITPIITEMVCMN